MRGSRAKERMSSREWFEVEPLDSVQGALNKVHASFGIELFISVLQCPQLRFYINRFFRDDGKEETYDSDVYQ